MVGVEGFEPPTSCSQSRRATRLRYTPNTEASAPRGAKFTGIANIGQCGPKVLSSLTHL